jgi:hypothetical protein
MKKNQCPIPWGKVGQMLQGWRIDFTDDDRMERPISRDFAGLFGSFSKKIQIIRVHRSAGTCFFRKSPIFECCKMIWSCKRFIFNGLHIRCLTIKRGKSHGFKPTVGNLIQGKET